MKRKFVFFLIRVIKLLKMQDKFMPELNSVPVKEIKIGRIYQHYGRIVLTHRHPHPEKCKVTFYNAFGSQITEEKYYELFRAGQTNNRIDASGQACELCDFNRLCLPCRCDFKEGIFRGYYEVIQSSRQYSDNPTI